MIDSLYEPFKKWSETGSIYLISDLHFDDEHCKSMDINWVTPDEQVDIINSIVMLNDTFICLGDVGNPEYINKINSRYKVLILGNHDKMSTYKNYFNEIYSGPLLVSDRILLSHEPIHGLRWCLNIHGHDHNNEEPYDNKCKYLNLAVNRCGYTPVSLGELIKQGALSGISNLHRITIDSKSESKKRKSFVL